MYAGTTILAVGMAASWSMAATGTPTGPAAREAQAQTAASDAWVGAMREVHAKFKGRPGTFAHFGDSITVTLAFWTPMLYQRENTPPGMEEAFQRVKAYLKPECWREWKGGRFGSEGGMTIRWAHQNVDKWLADLNPEVALIMFGTNDLNSVPLAEYETKTREVVQTCLDNGTVVILSTIPPRSAFVEKSATFAATVRRVAAEMKVPLIDLHAEILKRRPDDWDGRSPKFSAYTNNYDVPTLIARDGVHPSFPKKYQNDFSEEGLRNSGLTLRNYLALMAYADVLDRVLVVRNAPAVVAFTQRPQVTPTPDGVRIAFAVSRATDVEVAILDASGEVVRHLAAGVLGANAPAPFKKDALAQELSWDRTDDRGRPAAGGPFKARVSVGATPRLERIAGSDPRTLSGGIVGLTVGPEGEVFVLDRSGYGHANLRVFGRDGRYRRTILPFSAKTPKERMKAAYALDIDGETIPMVASGQSANVLPLVAGIKTQTMVMSPKGHLLLASAVGTMAEHGLPRHILAIHPQGGVPPETGLAGPEIRAPRGFMGGAGEAGTPYFDHLAASPDGEWIYFVPCNLADKKPRQAVFRLRWTDKELGKPFLGTDGEAGNDEKHFNDPQAVAVDKDGRICVCDRGNDRVVRFSPEGVYQGAFAVEKPEQIAVHPKTGEIYVLSRARPVQRGPVPSTLRKFAAWTQDAPRELARLEGRAVTLMALDPGAAPAKVWVTTTLAWSRDGVIPVTDEGDAFKVGEPINTFTGLRTPMFIAADPAGERVIIREEYVGNKGLFTLDLASGKMERFGTPPVVAADAVFGPDGNVYTMDGYNKNSLSRYAPDGKPLPFPGAQSHTVPTGVYRGYGPDNGMRGHCVDVHGNIYYYRSTNYGGPGAFGSRVDVLGPDGQPKQRNLVDGLGYGDCGLGVDAAGNLYLGANVKPKDRPFPDSFMGKVSAEPFQWWKPQQGPRERPWHFTFVNMYLFYGGSVLKFGPSGGALYGHPYEGEKSATNIPDVFFAAKAPAGAVTYASPYLGRELKVVGALWRYAGVGIVPSSSDGPRPDPGCVCMTSHLAVDEYGRVFAPNVFRFSVEMLDTNGNQMLRIGRYGNVDDAGPDIRFAWPAFVSVAKGKVYVSDPGACRVSVIRFDHAAEEFCEIR